MFQPRSIQSSLGIRDKILSLDFVLVISILLLGIILLEICGKMVLELLLFQQQ